MVQEEMCRTLGDNGSKTEESCQTCHDVERSRFLCWYLRIGFLSRRKGEGDLLK